MKKIKYVYCYKSVENLAYDERFKKDYKEKALGKILVIDENDYISGINKFNRPWYINAAVRKELGIELAEISIKDNII